MKNSILLKCLALGILFFCFKEADAQLASDTPAQAPNKPLVNAKPDSSVRVLASEAPILIKGSPNTKTRSPNTGKVILPSERVAEEKNAKKSVKKP